MTTRFKSLIQVLDYFKNEETCVKYLAVQRWGEQAVCPHCGSAKAPYITNRGYKCSDKDCHKKFTVTTGTIFENTKISLRYWFAAIYLGTAHKKGISSLQLSRDLAITQKTAWFLLHRVREMLANNAPQLLTGVVEIDETYVGGIERNKHKSKRNVKGTTGMKGKTPMVGCLQRDGKVVLHVITGSIANASIIKPIVRNFVDKSALLITDDYGAYSGLKHEYKGHEIIAHDKDEYVRGDFHTNTIEGFWSLLKRGIIGIYHQVSPKHLHRYCNEFGYRYNSRELSDCARFEDAFKQVHTRLTYAKLIS